MSRLCSTLLRYRNNITFGGLSANNRCIGFPSTRNVSSKKNDMGSSIQTYRDDNQISTNVRPISERIKETATTTSYLGVILIGVTVTAAMFYTIFSELFSNKSPNSVYTKALNECVNDPRVEDSLGPPIKGYGEETRRGRRRHVGHIVYKKGDVEHMRMKFYIQGSRRKATVHLDVCENASGKYEYEYLFVNVDDLRDTTIVLKNNQVDSKKYQESTQNNTEIW